MSINTDQYRNTENPGQYPIPVDTQYRNTDQYPIPINTQYRKYRSIPNTEKNPIPKNTEKNPVLPISETNPKSTDAGIFIIFLSIQELPAKELQCVWLSA